MRGKFCVLKLAGKNEYVYDVHGDVIEYGTEFSNAKKFFHSDLDDFNIVLFSVLNDCEILYYSFVSVGSGLINFMLRPLFSLFTGVLYRLGF